MSSERPSAEQRRFTERLNHLRQVLRPAGQERPLSAKQVATGVSDVTGTKLSESIIAYYIRGERMPGLDAAAAIARFFGVSAGYFTDDDVSDVDKDLEGVAFLRQLKEATVTNVAGRLGGLTAADLHTLQSIIGAEVRRRSGDQGEPPL